MTFAALNSCPHASATSIQASPSPARALKLRRNSKTSAQTEPTLKRMSSHRRLQSVPQNLAPVDLLMIKHGQFECGPGARPIVPRCMTALPENITEFLESLLPHGY
ncbi:MAG: hypothetical protein FJY29_13245 [Betaproteobacteria bacterium]|nr:hypothetical protein [Betaproteobacteria bacterium]